MNWCKKFLKLLFSFIFLATLPLVADTNFTQSDGNNTTYHLSWTENTQDYYEELNLSSNGTGIFNEYNVSENNTTTLKESGNFNWDVNSTDGKLYLSWIHGSCSGNDVYTLVERNSDYLSVSGNENETCDGNTSNESFSTKWFFTKEDALQNLSNTDNNNTSGDSNTSSGDSNTTSSDSNSSSNVNGAPTLSFKDITSVESLSLLGSFNQSGDARGIALSSDGNKVYLANGYDGLAIVDISDSSNPTLLGSYDTLGFTRDVKISSDGTKAYLADGTSELAIIDINDSSNPTLLSTHNYSNGEVFGISLSSDNTKVYLADIRKGLVIVDVSSPSAPITLGTYEDTTNTYDIDISSDDTKVYLADGSYGLKIIDVNNSSSPTLLGSYNTTGSALDVDISTDGTKAYIADGTNGLVIVDISDSFNPLSLGTYLTSDMARGVLVSNDGNKAYIADGTNGLVVIDITNSSNPTFLTSYKPSGFPSSHAIAISNDTSKIYIANTTVDMSIVDAVPNITLVKNFGDKNLTISLNDSGNDDIDMSIDLNNSNVISLGSYDQNLSSSEYQGDIYIPLQSMTDIIGKTKLTFNLSDGYNNISKELVVVVSADVNNSNDTNTTNDNNTSDSNSSSSDNTTSSDNNSSNVNSTSDLQMSPTDAFDGYMYLTNEINGTIYKLDANGTLINTIADGFRGVSGLIKDIDNNKFYISDDDNYIYQIETNGTVTKLNIDPSYLSNPNALAYNSGYLYIANAGSSIVRVNLSDLSAHTLVTGLDIPQGIRVNSNDNYLYFTDNYQALYRVDKDSNTTENNASALMVADLSSYMSSTDGGLAIDSYGNIYVSDYSGGKILQVQNDANRSVNTIFNIPGTNPRGIHYLGGMSGTHTLFATIFNEAKVVQIQLDPFIPEDANVTLFSNLSGNASEGPFGIIVDNIDLPILSYNSDSNSSSDSNTSYGDSNNTSSGDSNNTYGDNNSTSSGDSNTTSGDNNSSYGGSGSQLEKVIITSSSSIGLYDYNSTSSSFVYDQNESYTTNSDNSINVSSTDDNGNPDNFIVKYLGIDQNATDEMNNYYGNSYSDVEIHLMYLNETDGYNYERVYVSDNEQNVINLSSESTRPSYALEGPLSQSEFEGASAQAISVNFKFYINEDNNSSSSSDSNSSYGDNNSSNDSNSSYGDNGSGSSGDSNSSSGDNNSSSSGDNNSSSSGSSGNSELERIKIENSDTISIYDYNKSISDFEFDQNDSYSVNSDNSVDITSQSDDGGTENFTLKYLAIDQNATDEMRNFYNGGYSDIEVHKFYIQEGSDYQFLRVFVSNNESSVISLMDESTHPDFELSGNIDQSEYEGTSAQAMSVGFEFYINEEDDSNSNGSNNGDNSGSGDSTGGSDDDYQNDFPYQVVGTVTLPALDSDDVFGTGMSVQPTSGNNWNSTFIGTTEGNNSYTLGMESGKYVLRFEMYKNSGFEEYIYEANSSSWKPSSEVEYIGVDENGNKVKDGEEAYSFIPDVTPIDTTDFNSSNKLGVDFDLEALYANLYTLEGKVIVSSDFSSAEYCSNSPQWDGNASSLEICEWYSNGVSGYNNWVGANRLGISIQSVKTGEHIGWYSLNENDANTSNGSKTYNFSTKLSSEGNYSIRINKELFDTSSGETSWESYFFNPETQDLIDEKLVKWTESNETDNFGNNLWLPDQNQTGYVSVTEVNGSKVADFGTIDFVSFESGQIKLNGTVSFDSADYVQMELIKTSNGSWFGWTQINNSGGDFNITLPQGAGEYILRVSKVTEHNWESYYYDQNNSRLVQDKNIEWIQVDGNWMPNPSKTGVIKVSDTNNDGEITQADISNLTLDLTSSAIDSSFYVVEGNVTVESDFSAGEVRDSSGNWIGYSNISFEVIDKDTGEWKGWFEVDRDSNTTDGNGNKVYTYKITLDQPDEYLLQVRYERNSDGYNEYKGYFFDENTTVSDRTVFYKELSNGTWVPDTNVSVTLDSNNRKITRNIDFVEIANSVYKLSGTVTVPSGFTPNYGWGENRAMVRIEAINGDTGEWIADGFISDDPVSGTTDQYKYSFELPQAMQNTNIIVKLVIEDGFSWDAYFIDFGSEHNSTDSLTLVSENSVKYMETNTTDNNGYKIWAPNIDDTGYITLGTTKTIDLDLDIPTLTTVLENNKLSFAGKIVLSESITLGESGSYFNNISLEAINKSTGQWASYQDVDYKADSSDEFTFELEFAEAGDYIIKVNLNIDGTWEDYYINFGNNHTGLTDSNETTYSLVAGNKVQWEDINGTWMPDPSKSGYLSVSSKVENYTIDISSYEDSIKKISGTITVADDFTVGDKFDSSGNWIGYTSLRIEAISKSTGEWIASTEMVSKTTNTDYYPYELKIGDTTQVGTEFIIRISKNVYYDGSWEGQELYINFGDNHEFDYSDSIVSGNRVQWMEADEYVSGRTWKQWMPNPDSTGWITIGDSNVEGVNVDLTTLGQNDIKINGSVSGLPSDTDEARVGVIDASTGMWVSDATVSLATSSSGTKEGNFSVNLGDASVAAGNYVVQLTYEHRDFTNWENSWYRNRFIDFGSDNSVDGGDDSILSNSEVTWQYSSTSNNWIPQVNYLTVGSYTIDGLVIDLSSVQGITLNGTISGIPSGASQAYAWISNTSNYNGVWSELKASSDGTTYTFSAEELKADTNYTLEFGYNANNKFYNYFIKDDNGNLSDGVSAVAGNEVRFVNSGNNVWNPNSEDTTYLSLSVDLNLSINFTIATLNTVKVTLEGTGDGETVSADMNIPGKPFGRWAETISSGTSATFTFEDVKDGTQQYVLSFWYSGNQYTCNSATNSTGCNELVKNVQWYAYDSSDNQVCPTSTGSWECDWDNSSNWAWKPNGITPLTVSGDVNITATLPEEKTVSGTLSLGSEFANEKAYLSIYKYNGSEYLWSDYTLGSSGDGNISVKVAGGTNYRIELWVDSLGGYVYTESGWITQNNSMEENNSTNAFEPKGSTLIDLSANKDLGSINLTSGLSLVTIVLENLDTDSNGNVNENVWLNFESDTNGKFGIGNADWQASPITYDSNISIRVPNGSDYKISAFPSAHKGGYASDGNGDSNDTITTASNFSWNESDYFNISGDTTITFSFPNNNTLGDINGTVTCDDNNASADCSGWIQATSSSESKGSLVSSDGTFEIRGLSEGTYELEYFADSGISFKKSDVSVTQDSVSTVSVAKDRSNMFESITGSISGDTTNVYVALIETDGSSYEVIATADLDSSANFSFPALSKVSSGKSLVVAAAKRTKNADYSTTVKFDEATEVYENGTVSLPTLPSEDFTSGLSATANEYN